MKLSTKGRYGLKAMIDLATEYGKCRLSVSQLAERQGISDAYLEQLIATLKKAGLLDAARGASGGYTLTRPPEDICVGEVLRALEGSTAIMDCVGVSDNAECSNACYCSARPLWIRLQQKIDEVLNTTTIKELADDYAARTGKE